MLTKIDRQAARTAIRETLGWAYRDIMEAVPASSGPSRDTLAAMAMQGILAHDGYGAGTKYEAIAEDRALLAERAYAIADAMMEERARREEAAAAKEEAAAKKP
jgi:hypothetical protein